MPAMSCAVVLWRQQGALLFPSLLNDSIVRALREDIVARSTTHGAVTVDRSMDIRSPSNRQLIALPVDRNPSALEAIARELTPFLNEALQDTKHLLLERAAYRIAPGALEQEFNRTTA